MICFFSIYHFTSTGFARSAFAHPRIAPTHRMRLPICIQIFCLSPDRHPPTHRQVRADTVRRADALSAQQRAAADAQLALAEQSEQLRQFEAKLGAKQAQLRADLEQLKQAREVEQDRLQRWAAQLDARQLQIAREADEAAVVRERETAKAKREAAEEDERRRERHREAAAAAKRRADELDAREV